MLCDVLVRLVLPYNKFLTFKVIHVHFIDPNDRDHDAGERMERNKLLKRSFSYQVQTQSKAFQRVSRYHKWWDSAKSSTELLKRLISSRLILSTWWSSPFTVELSIAKWPFERRVSQSVNSIQNRLCKCTCSREISPKNRRKSYGWMIAWNCMASSLIYKNIYMGRIHRSVGHCWRISNCRWGIYKVPEEHRNTLWYEPIFDRNVKV